MTEENTYWMAGPNGEKAIVEGDAERDRLSPHGWSETTEPVDGDFVWMAHPDVEKPGLVAWAAREYWQGTDWRPSAPPEPVNPALNPVLTDPAEGEQKRKTPPRQQTSAAPAAPKNKE